jgi:hypothetical protein
VHHNSGVNNKLCYLLTDGERFREITVTGMGIDPVAHLYYEANTNLLTSSSGWADLARALRRAAVNLGWSDAQRTNLENALQAVGIGSALPQYYMDENGSTACIQTGDSYCSFLFDGGPFRSFSEAFAASPSPGTLLLRGTGHTTRIAAPVSIRPWDGPARIAP